MAALLLLVYPEESRSYMAGAFTEAAERVWSRRRVRSGALTAVLTTAAWLLADTARAAPRAWWDAVWAGSGGRRPRPPRPPRVHHLRDDLRSAWRRLRRSPGFAATAVVTLALTVGANTAILGVADAVLFRPLPYADPDGLQLVAMENRVTGAPFAWVRYTFVRAIQDHPELGEIGLAEAGPTLVDDPGAGAVPVATATVTANYFRLLGVKALRGRLFRPDDASQGADAVVLTHAFWRQRFGGDPSLAGTTVTLGDRTVRVLGVLPADFVFPSPSLGTPQVVTLLPMPATDAAGGTMHPLLRLPGGMSRERAQRRLDALTAPLLERDGVDAGTIPTLVAVRGTLFAAGGPIVKALLASGLLVLILGCANLANLFVVRGARLERETGVRIALGASGSRLVRPLLLEALLVSLLGAAAAALLGALVFGWLQSWIPPVAYAGARVGVDVRVLAWTLLLGLTAGAGFSVVPAIRTWRTDPQVLLSRGASSRGSLGVLGQPLVVVQVALAVALVFGAGITGRVVSRMLRLPLGFAPERVALLSVAPPEHASGREAEAFYRQLLRTLSERGDVLAAGASGTVPLVRPVAWAEVPTGDGSGGAASVVQVLPGFFSATGIHIREGRPLSESDGDAAVAVVSSAAARRLFGAGGALGRTFRDHRGRVRTVVGVADDARLDLDPNFQPPVYVVPGDETRRLTVIVKTREADRSVLESLRREATALAPERVVGAEWWNRAIAARTEVRDPRFQTLVLGGFAGLALILSALGVGAVVAFVVGSRRRELGIRLALGCRPGALVKQVLGRAMVPVLVGLLGGLLLTRLAAGLARAQLFQVDTGDPMVLSAAAAAVLLAALFAAFVPARAAVRAHPELGERSGR